MASWHEIKRISGGLSRYSNDHRTRQIVQRSEQYRDLFEAHYVRQTSSGLFPPSEDCIQLWPLEPITASSAQEARDKALSLLEIAAGGDHDDLFEKRPCPIPAHRRRVKEVASTTHRALAWIIKDSDTRYEVRYFGDLMGCDWEEGWRLSVPAVEGVNAPDGYEVLTLADSLESAEEIALLELEQIASGDTIKRKEA